MIVIGQDALVARWVSERIDGHPSWKEPRAIGVAQDGYLVGGVVYTNYRDGTIEMCVAGEGNWLSKGALKAFFGYPFRQLGCRRVTAIVGKRNRRSRDFVERLGFKLEGMLRKGFENDDACIYGMLREDCRYG